VGVVSPVQQILPAGRCLTGSSLLTARSGVANSTMAFLPIAQGRVHGLEVQVAAAADTMSSPARATVSSRADCILQLTSAQAVRGILAIRIEARPSGGAHGIGNFQVDVDADGTVELTGGLLAAPWVDYVEIARSFGPGMLPVRISHSGQLDVPPWFIGEYSCNVSVRWIPDTGPIAPYGSGCGLTLREERQGNGDFGFLLGSGSAPAPGTWLLLGFASRNIVLPMPPGCLQLTTMDVVLPWVTTRLTVPSVPLPPGFVMHMQAVEFAAQSTRTSNGLRLAVAP
jgi:hypothetical protein